MLKQCIGAGVTAACFVVSPSVVRALWAVLAAVGRSVLGAAVRVVGMCDDTVTPSTSLCAWVSGPAKAPPPRQARQDLAGGSWSWRQARLATRHAQIEYAAHSQYYDSRGVEHHAIRRYNGMLPLLSIYVHCQCLGYRTRSNRKQALPFHSERGEVTLAMRWLYHADTFNHTTCVADPASALQLA